MATPVNRIPGNDPEEEEQTVEETSEEEVVPEVEEVDENEGEEYDSRKKDPDEQAWPGGPNFGQINEWKDEYGDGNVYITALTPEVLVAWRTLTRPEYRALSKSMEKALASGASQSDANLNNEEAIAEISILYPPYDRRDPKAMAGTASTISMQVMEASGFQAVDVRQL